MIFTRQLALSALILLIASTGSLAQERLQTYLLATDAILDRANSSLNSFVSEATALKQERDVVALKASSDKQIRTWNAILTELKEINPPEEASKHFASLRSLILFQQENNEILSSTLGSQLKLVQELQDMKNQGLTAKELELHAQENALDHELLEKRLQDIRKGVHKSQEALSTERQRLNSF